MKTFLTAAVALMLTALAAVAGDVNGKWQSEFTRQDGEKFVTTYTFKAEAEKLTGTISSPMGERSIEDGKISGDDLSFVMKLTFNGEDVTLKYTGKIVENEIKFTVETPRGSREFVAKKAVS